MIEVFKTNIRHSHHASMLIARIQRSFFHYQANFDLQDCDHVLRVKCISGSVQPALIIDLLKEAGFEGEVLPDEIPVSSHYAVHRL